MSRTEEGKPAEVAKSQAYSTYPMTPQNCSSLQMTLGYGYTTVSIDLLDATYAFRLQIKHN